MELRQICSRGKSSRCVWMSAAHESDVILLDSSQVYQNFKSETLHLVRKAIVQPSRAVENGRIAPYPLDPTVAPFGLILQFLLYINIRR